MGVKGLKEEVERLNDLVDNYRDEVKKHEDDMVLMKKLKGNLKEAYNDSLEENLLKENLLMEKNITIKALSKALIKLV